MMGQNYYIFRCVFTHVEYDAWHWRKFFYVNVRQNVHQVTFSAGGKTQSSSGKQSAVG